MEIENEEDNLLIRGLHLQAPQLGRHRVASDSFPDNSLYGCSKVLVGSSRSLPKMSGSLQTQYTHRHVPSARLHGTLPVNAPQHRERLSTTNTNTLVFGDNPQGRRVRRIQRGQQANDPFLMEEIDGRHFEILIPYLEPVMYASWLIPLNVSVIKLLTQIAYFDGDDVVFQQMLSLSSSAFFLSMIMDPLPAILFLEFDRTYTLTSFFYNHHIAAIEGLVVSQTANFALSYLEVAAESRLGTLLTTFFLTFMVRHMQRRSGVSSKTYSLGEYFLMIIIY